MTFTDGLQSESRLFFLTSELVLQSGQYETLEILLPIVNGSPQLLADSSHFYSQIIEIGLKWIKRIEVIYKAMKNNYKKNGNVITEKIDVLREVTLALLDEVKSLGTLRKVEIENGINFDEEVKSFEILLIERALEQTGGSQLHAARLLNLKHTTLNAKIKRYQIQMGRRSNSLEIAK